ncbi:MAG: hypothetical protein AAFV53_04830 [Myxococcota bacterium]
MKTAWFICDVAMQNNCCFAAWSVQSEGICASMMNIVFGDGVAFRVGQ